VYIGFDQKWILNIAGSGTRNAPACQVSTQMVNAQLSKFSRSFLRGLPSP